MINVQCHFDVIGMCEGIAHVDHHRRLNLAFVWYCRIRRHGLCDGLCLVFVSFTCGFDHDELVIRVVSESVVGHGQVVCGREQQRRRVDLDTAQGMPVAETDVAAQFIPIGIIERDTGVGVQAVFVGIVVQNNGEFCVGARLKPEPEEIDVVRRVQVTGDQFGRFHQISP